MPKYIFPVKRKKHRAIHSGMLLSNVSPYVIVDWGISMCIKNPNREHYKFMRSLWLEFNDDERYTWISRKKLIIVGQWWDFLEEKPSRCLQQSNMDKQLWNSFPSSLWTEDYKVNLVHHWI